MQIVDSINTTAAIPAIRPQLDRDGRRAQYETRAQPKKRAKYSAQNTMPVAVPKSLFRRETPLKKVRSLSGVNVANVEKLIKKISIVSAEEIVQWLEKEIELSNKG